MKRIFFAVHISEATREIFRKIKTEIPQLGDGFRIVDADSCHVTLKFLGDTQESLIPDIIQKVEAALEEVQSSGFSAAGTGVFPNPRRPRVLWLGITEGLDELKTLAQKIDNVTAGFGFPKEEREFKAHITFGRVKKDHFRPAGMDAFLLYKYPTLSNPVETVVLVESKLTPQGAIYTVLHTFHLKNQENQHGH